MKKNPLLIIGVILLFSICHIFGAENNDDVPPLVQVADSQQNFGPWIKHGKLICRSVRSYTWEFEAYSYQTASGKWIMLDNIPGINVFLKDEINTKDAVNDFLNLQLSQLLLASFAGSWSSMIDKYFTDTVDAHAMFLTAPTATQIKKLKAYVSSRIAIVTKNTWTLNMNVLNRLGGVERWSVTGQVEPFQISSFKIEIAEPNGTYPESGGIGG